eukprot:TRINITY_DN4770_c0_g1_i1.p1 TRINITY_DN4770_c0_g1~~TRINITY_DN4770_c0_g1_i1.p1  ORF type:complete len:266 (+),score=103.14 TRINITY_DN4770_c0_g1_i1:55-852(+)
MQLTTLDDTTCLSSSTGGNSSEESMPSVSLTRVSSLVLCDYCEEDAEELQQEPKIKEGTRVVTRCALTDAHRHSSVLHPAGSVGRVYAVRSDGVLLIALDNEACALQLVLAEPHDLEFTGDIPKGTRVRLAHAQVRSALGMTEVSPAQVGEVMAFDAEKGLYELGYSALMVRFWISANQLHVVPTQKNKPSRILRKVRSLFSKKQEDDAACCGAAAGLPCVANLKKTPEYSNVRNSPRGTYRSRSLSLLAAPPSLTAGFEAFANH